MALDDPPLTPARRLLRFLPLLIMLGVIATVYASGANRWVAFETLRERHVELKGFVDTHFWLALALYAALYAAITAVALPGAVFVTLAGGFLFGAVINGPLTAFSATLGAVVVYTVTRTAVGEFLRERARHGGPAVRMLQRAIEKSGFWGLLSVRLAPVVPFALVNVISGLVGVPMRNFLAATFLGTLPATLIYSAIGSGLDKTFAEGRGVEFGDPRVWLPLTGLFLLSLLPLLLRRRPEESGSDTGMPPR